MNIFNELKNKFKHVFMLNLSTRTDRRDIMITQLKDFGLSDNFRQTDLDIRYTTPFGKYNKIIMMVMNQNKFGRFTKPNEVDCTRNHYAMVKQAYDHGYEYCLILEDDIRFLKDNTVWESFLKNVPNDFDILQFGCFTADPNIKKYMDASKWWVKHPDIGLWTTSMYALSRKGMEYFINFFDKFLWVADGPLYRAPLDRTDLNTYICTIPLVIQEDKNIDPSDIRDEINDTIDYNTQNMYEYNVIRDNYWNLK